MNSISIKSVLNDVLEDISQTKDLIKIKNICYARIKNSRINSEDKIKMLHIISIKHNYFSLVKTIYDLILKYEGEGVIK